MKRKQKKGDDDEPIWLDSDEDDAIDHDIGLEPAAGNQEQNVDRKRKLPQPDWITTIDDDSEDDGIEVVCPVCAKSFSANTDTNTMNQHINACLDQQTATARPSAGTDKSMGKGKKKDLQKATKKIKTSKTAKPKDVFDMLMKGRKQ
jgi:hypothetical protein